MVKLNATWRLHSSIPTFLNRFFSPKLENLQQKDGHAREMLVDYHIDQKLKLIFELSLFESFHKFLDVRKLQDDNLSFIEPLKISFFLLSNLNSWAKKLPEKMQVVFANKDPISLYFFKLKQLYYFVDQSEFIYILQRNSYPLS